MLFESSVGFLGWSILIELDVVRFLKKSEDFLLKPKVKARCHKVAPAVFR
jgi:hypothetical protein